MEAEASAFDNIDFALLILCIAIPFQSASAHMLQASAEVNDETGEPLLSPVKSMPVKQRHTALGDSIHASRPWVGYMQHDMRMGGDRPPPTLASMPLRMRSKCVHAPPHELVFAIF